MDFVIDSKVFGTPFHLYCKQDGSVEKVRTYPEGVLRTDSNEAVFLSNLFKQDIPTFPPRKYVRSFFGLVDINTTIPWIDVMSPEVYAEEVKSYVAEMKHVFLNINRNYYDTAYKAHTPLLESFCPAKINQAAYEELMSGEHNDANLSSFEPSQNGVALTVRYDRLSSITGRLSVKKGPNILTLKKELRGQLLQSKYSGGSVRSLDYTSLEPRVLLAFMGKKDIPEDIYSAALEALDIDIPREVIKLAIISRLYGAQDETIAYQLQNRVDYPQDVLDMVDDYFQIHEAKEKILSEYFISATGTLHNLYDRPIRFDNAEPHKLLNYFIQSSAVDVALYGFAEIMRRVNLAELKGFDPLFILHDALIVDMSEQNKILLPKITKAGAVNIPKLESTTFFMTEEKMSR